MDNSARSAEQLEVPKRKAKVELAVYHRVRHASSQHLPLFFMDTCMGTAGDL